MKSAQKYSKISTWPQNITIHNMPLLEKDGKSEQAGRLSSSYSDKKNKKGRTSIAASVAVI